MAHSLRKKIFISALFGSISASAFLFPAGAAPLYADANTSMNVAQKQNKVPATDPRINDFEQQLRELNGKIEELTHALGELQDEVSRLGGKISPRSGNIVERLYPQKADKVEDTQKPQALPQKTLGTLELNKAGTVVGTGTAVEENKNPDSQSPISYDVTIDTVPQTQNAKELFDMGEDYLKAENYASAEAVFTVFPLRYPEDALNSDVTFSLGEVRFALHRYREAAQTYLLFYDNYPNSPRQPENLLNLGMSLAAMNDHETACETFAVVGEKYKSANPDIMKRIKEEQSRNKCQ